VTLSSNIKIRRLELGLTQQQLADAVGYKTRSAIAKIEAGESEVPLSKLVPFAQALDTTVERLLEGLEYEGDHALRNQAGRRLTPYGQGPRVAAVILAGGHSTRNRQNIPNQFVNILGKPVIGYCMEAYQRHPLIDDIFVVCLREYHDVLAAYAQRFGIGKLAGILPEAATGVQSVRAGFEQAVHAGYRHSDIIVFQESTRPLVTEEMITRIVGAAREWGSAITGSSMADNVQFYRTSDGGFKSLDRERVVDLQSPDAHSISHLREVFELADAQSHPCLESNLGMLMHELGLPLHFCHGPRNNVKIVRQEDVDVAAALLKRRL